MGLVLLSQVQSKRKVFACLFNDSRTLSLSSATCARQACSMCRWLKQVPSMREASQQHPRRTTHTGTLFKLGWAVLTPCSLMECGSPLPHHRELARNICVRAKPSRYRQRPQDGCRTGEGCTVEFLEWPGVICPTLPYTSVCCGFFSRERSRCSTRSTCPTGGSSLPSPSNVRVGLQNGMKRCTPVRKHITTVALQHNTTITMNMHVTSKDAMVEVAATWFGAF